ncbi:uncharacterized protein LOC110449324 [Mizuhopecten yessoensis]|uniref:Uncharacterized protein n=1 Tax=Mizuhopecten yessoensis TaxID=6573 RepID=A0A210QRH8_MIZYE|nr:uncharacterized protein LOC110449324 [Mizuhopecten yessoensis]OWF51333.1 hypothetical protein KP79_PYT09670 [Mizuhopecten yessoensis]
MAAAVLVDPPPLKKHKRHAIIDNLIGRLGDNLPLVQKAIKSLSEGSFNALFFLKMISCNGCTGFGVRFSDAFCETETLQEEFFPFYSVFTKGTDMLYNCLKHPSHADSQDDISRILLARLFTFITDTASMTFIKDLERKSCGTLSNETQITIALAEHVFSKLALSSSYSIDETCRNHGEFTRGVCQCGCKSDVKYRLGDTSVGEPAVWHGCLDIILGHGEDCVPILISGDKEVRHGDKTSVEVMCKNLNYNEIKHPMIAQAIVFSFLQKKKYPDSKNLFVPAIGVSAKEVIFFLYDCKEDVLMQSVKMPWRSGKGVRYSTLIAVWLVVNYKYLGSGLTGNLEHAPKSNFFSLAGEVLNVYKNDLIMGSVRGSYEEDTVYPEEIPEEKIVWPNGKPNFEF